MRDVARRACLWLLLAALMCLAGCAPTAIGSEVVLLSTAQAELRPDHGPMLSTQLRLPHRWDRSYPRDEGRVIYRLSLPPIRRDEPHGLFITRVGNQAEVRVAGQIVVRMGILGNPASDAAKGPTWVNIPPALLSRTVPTPLEIEVTAQAGRWGGLSGVAFGPESELLDDYQVNYRWRQHAAVVIVIGLLLMGLIAAGIWWRQREDLYGLFALTAFFGVIRMGDRLLPEPPLPWPLWGGVAAAAFAAHLAMIARFSMMVVGVRRRWIDWCFHAFIAWSTVAAMVAFLWRRPELWTAVLASLFLPGLVALGAVVHRATWRRTRESLLLCVAGGLVVAAGVRDFLLVRLPESGSMNFSVQPHAIFAFTLFMAWIIVERYTAKTQQIQELNQTLEARVALREAELNRSYEALQRQGEQQAALQERQRIMRDIHDGVGAQLVGLLSMIRRDDVQREALREHVNAALDELRMAVDSLQPVHGDLATVLATLRYRLQPRLQAAGLSMSWDVAELPAIAGLTPQTVLQIQRILLEAFTNILRHAKATQVEVRARYDSASELLDISVRDNGCGFASPAAGGQGLSNMRARAAAIGAQLRVESSPGEGTCVRLDLPTS